MSAKKYVVVVGNVNVCLWWCEEKIKNGNEKPLQRFTFDTMKKEKKKEQKV